MAIKKAIGRTSLKILETSGGINIINRRGKSLIKITESGVVGADLEQNDSNTNVISVNPSTGIFELTSVASLTAGEWSVSGSDLYYSAGKVSVGTATPAANGILTVQGTTADSTESPIIVINSSAVNVFEVNNIGELIARAVDGSNYGGILAKADGSVNYRRNGINKIAFTTGLININVGGTDDTIIEAGTISNMIVVDNGADQAGIGTATMTASSLLTVKGTTNDGTTKCVSFVDSDDAEVAFIDTDGDITSKSKFTLSGVNEHTIEEFGGNWAVFRGTTRKFMVGNTTITSSDDFRVTDTGQTGFSFYAEASGNFNNSFGSDTPSSTARVLIKGSTADGSTDCLLLTDSADATVASIDTDGNTYFAGQLGVGASSPATMLEVSDNIVTIRGEDPSVTMSDFTGIGLSPNITTKTVYQFAQANSTAGGLSISAFSNSTASNSVLQLTGYHGSTAPTGPPVLIRGYKHNGGTSRTALAASELVISFKNGTNTIAEIYGNGGFLAATVVEANTDVAASPNVLTAEESGKVLTNEGATAENHHDLPSAVAGLGPYTFIVQDVDGMQINAATGDTIRIAASVSAGGGLIETTTIGNTVTLVCINATEWVATAVNGTWTVT